MQDQQREILNQVARGAISAEEGAARLEALEDVVPSATQAPPPPTGSAAAPAGRQVRIVSQFGAADVLGDPTVAFAIADGPHRARQDGDTMVFEHEPLVDDSGAFFFGSRGWRSRRLIVRMNPELALTATLQGGNLRVDGVRGAIAADIQAGNCNLSGFHGPLSLSVQAGNVTGSGRLDSGASTIRCEMGAVKIGLDKASSVRITARTTLGKVAIHVGNLFESSVSGTREATIGAGAARLDIDCTMGNVSVFTE